MGEMAEAMLNGEMCEGCGEALECEATGFPSYCSKQCAKDRGADWFGDETDTEADEEFLDILDEYGIKYVCLSQQSHHFRCGNWDFWTTTEKFYNYRTKEKGCGVMNLVEILKGQTAKANVDLMKEIEKAWCDAGKRPDHHEAAKYALKKQWFTLYNALEKAFPKK